MTLMHAIEIIEGMDDATPQQELEAWSFIGKSHAYLYLQGFYGRTLRQIMEAGHLDNEFNVTDELTRNKNGK